MTPMSYLLGAGFNAGDCVVRRLHHVGLFESKR